MVNFRNFAKQLLREYVPYMDWILFLLKLSDMTFLSTWLTRFLTYFIAMAVLGNEVLTGEMKLPPLDRLSSSPLYMYMEDRYYTGAENFTENRNCTCGFSKDECSVVMFKATICTADNIASATEYMQNQTAQAYELASNVTQVLGEHAYNAASYVVEVAPNATAQVVNKTAEVVGDVSRVLGKHAYNAASYIVEVTPNVTAQLANKTSEAYQVARDVTQSLGKHTSNAASYIKDVAPNVTAQAVTAMKDLGQQAKAAWNNLFS